MPQSLQAINRIVVHHSGSPLTTTVKDINAWHKQRGWTMVGYHYVIEGDGIVRVGRPLDMIPSAQLGGNMNTATICVVGDNTKPGSEWKPEQWDSLEGLIMALYLVLGHQIPVCGHRDVMKPGYTECPGFDIKIALQNKPGIVVGV